MTCYGAIGDCLSRPVYYWANSTRQDHYRAFLSLVHGSVKPEVGKAFLLQDGHRAHTTNLSKRLASRLFIAFSTVPHSSNFNSIETVWSVAKRNFQKLMQYERGVLTKPDFLAMVKRAVYQIPVQKIDNMVSANRKHVLGYLE